MLYLLLLSASIEERFSRMKYFELFNLFIYFFSGSSSTTGAGLTSEGSSKESGAIRAWKVGDKCLAVWSEDSQW